MRDINWESFTQILVFLNLVGCCFVCFGFVYNKLRVKQICLSFKSVAPHRLKREPLEHPSMLVLCWHLLLL